MGRPLLARLRLRLAGDSGFTLVEAVVALFVLGIVFTALAAASIGSLRASFVSRAEQQGVDFATQAMEKARAMAYGDLTMTTADLAGDPRIVTCPEGKCIVVDTGIQEELIAQPTGGIAQHRAQIASALSNQLPVTIATYVTNPKDTDAVYKRVTVVANWTVGGVARTRTMSSLVTETNRGLPIPVFKLTPLGSTSQTINADFDVPFGFELSNQGAPDRWNLTIGGAAPWQWSLFRDDGNKVWDDDPAIDVPLTNTNAPDDALLDTGRIDPTASVVFWAVRAVPAGTPAGDTWSLLTATSAAQPGAATGTASVDMLVRVVVGAVTGGGGSGEVTTTPGAPTGLVLTTGDGRLDAAWTAPASSGSSDITDYVVSYKLTSATAWTVFTDGVSTATTASITGLVNGSTYDVSVVAKNSVGPGTQAATAQGRPEAAVTYVAPVRCAAAIAPPSPAAVSKYSLRQYTLHNRSAANPTWPGVGVPLPTSTTGQGLPLVAAVDAPQVPANTTLPVYSSNLVATEPGRIINAGGSLLSAVTTDVVDWRGSVGGRTYDGDLVVQFWVAPVTGDDVALPWSITAQPYIGSSSGVGASLATAVTASGATNSFGASGCTGWQQVWMKFPVSKRLKNDEYVGVRVWTAGGVGKMARLRVGYDVVGDFPANFQVWEK